MRRNVITIIKFTEAQAEGPSEPFRGGARRRATACRLMRRQRSRRAARVERRRKLARRRSEPRGGRAAALLVGHRSAGEHIGGQSAVNDRCVCIYAVEDERLRLLFCSALARS